MLACIQRRQNFPSHHVTCSAKSVMAATPPQLLPAPQPRPQLGVSKGGAASLASRYPSTAELDAFAQKTSRSPLSIKIFQTEVRVPQHKQLNKTINGLDTTSSYSYNRSGGHQGLLAVVKASVSVRAVVKSSEGKRTKHLSGQTNMAPYNSISHGYRHKAYHSSSCKASEGGTRVLSGGSCLVPQQELAQVQSLIRQMSKNPHRAPLQLGGEARASPSVQPAVAPQSGAEHRQQQQQRGMWMYQAGAGTLAGSGSRAGAGTLAGSGTLIGQSPESVMSLAYPVSQLQYMRHPPGAAQDRVSCTLGDFSTASLTKEEVYRPNMSGPFLAPLWDNNITSSCITSAPNSDNNYHSQLLASGVCSVRPRDLPQSTLHPCQHHQTHHPGLHSHLAYSGDQSLTGGLPTSSLCHASVLSSSLQSLESLISEIQPPCIKERMLGRGYRAVGVPLLLHHHPHGYLQLPVQD